MKMEKTKKLDIILIIMGANLLVIFLCCIKLILTKLFLFWIIGSILALINLILYFYYRKLRSEEENDKTITE